MTEKLKIQAWTDGSCLGNPGVGGYAAYMKAKDKEKHCCGYSANERETSPRMELYAVICVLDWVNKIQKEPCEIEINTDSEILIKCSQHSDYSLIAPERKNHDLWLQYITKRDQGKHTIVWKKVPGHSDCEMNRKADKLAREMAVKARHEVFDKRR